MRENVESTWVAWVGWTAPRWARLACVVLAALLGGRAAVSAGPVAAVAASLTGGVYAALLCLGAPRLGHLAMALAPPATLASGGLAALGLGDAMAPRDQIVLFGNGAYEDSRALWSGGPASREILDTYEAGTMLWERGAPLDLLLRGDPRWRLVHQDALAVVHVRVQ